MFPFFCSLMHFLLCTKKELKSWVVPPQLCSSLTIPAFLPALVEVKSARQLAFGSALFTSNCGSSIFGRPYIFHIHILLSPHHFHHKQDQVNNADSAIIFLIDHCSVRIGLNGPRGSRDRLQGLRGSRGRPTGSQGVKG